MKRILGLVSLMVSVVWAQPQPGVSMSVSAELVPAGGVAQIKVFLTEPKPIVRSRMTTSLDEYFFPDLLGISAAGGLTGVAQRRDGKLRVELSTITPDLLNSDYPILTVAVRTNPNLPGGAMMPVDLNVADSYWMNALGQPYPKEAHAGSVTIGGTTYIGNVEPGGGKLKAGESFRVTGGGFVQDMKARAEGARLESVTPAEFVMAAKEPMKLDGTRIRIRLPNQEEQTYFAYPRPVKKTLGTHPNLEGMVPVFSTGAALEAMAPLSQNKALKAAGIQNPTGTPVRVQVAALSLTGQVIISKVVTLGAMEMVFQSTEEIMGAPWPADAYWLRMRASGPVQLAVAEVGAGIRVPAVVIVRGASY
jgi:hypothetical protein